MEGFKNNDEIFERRLLSLKSFWDALGSKDFIVGGKKRKMDMMPFDDVENYLRRHVPIPLCMTFGGSGLRVSFDRNEGVKIWFTNSLEEHPDYQEAKQEIKNLWEETKNSE